MARRSWLRNRGVTAALVAVILIVQSVMPVAAQGAAIEVDDSGGHGIAAGEVKDLYAPGRAIVTVQNLRRFWVAIDPEDQWGSMTFDPAPISGDHGDLDGAWATIAVIPPHGTAAYDISWDPTASSGQAFRIHFHDISAGGLASAALNIVQMVGYALGEAQLKGGAEAASMAIRALTQLPEWEDIVRKNQGDAMALADLPAVVKALLGSGTGRRALREALGAVGIEVGLPALQKLATGVSGTEVLLFLKDLGEAVGKGQVDGSVSFFAVLPTGSAQPAVTGPNTPRGDCDPATSGFANPEDLRKRLPASVLGQALQSTTNYTEDCWPTVWFSLDEGATDARLTGLTYVFPGLADHDRLDLGLDMTLGTVHEPWEGPSTPATRSGWQGVDGEFNGQPFFAATLADTYVLTFGQSQYIDAFLEAFGAAIREAPRSTYACEPETSGIASGEDLEALLPATVLGDDLWSDADRLGPLGPIRHDLIFSWETPSGYFHAGSLWVAPGLCGLALLWETLPLFLSGTPEHVTSIRSASLAGWQGFDVWTSTPNRTERYFVGAYGDLLAVMRWKPRYVKEVLGFVRERLTE